MPDIIAHYRSLPSRHLGSNVMPRVGFVSVNLMQVHKWRLFYTYVPIFFLVIDLNINYREQNIE